MSWNLIFASWVISLVSTAGSLFFSEVMMYPPCILCWYQRICMYPLVLILGAGLFSSEKEVFRFAFPLSLTGLLIAVYHNLLYYHVLPESIAPCRSGVSCTTAQVEWLGFITIPLLSLTAFVLINLLLIIARRSSREKR